MATTEQGASRRAVEGLKLLLEKREEALAGSLNGDGIRRYAPPNQHTIGGPNGLYSGPQWVWRKGDALANAAAKHAQRILAAVQEYRATRDELEALQEGL